MRRLVLPLLALLALSSGCAQKTIPIGYVGVKVNNWGSNRGVQNYTTVTGRVIYNSITEDVHVYPTYLQNYTWTADDKDDVGDESITFNSKEGAPINADIAIGVTIPAPAVPSVFNRYRQDAFAFVHGPIRTIVRDQFIRHASTMGVMEIMGSQSGALTDSVLASVRHSLVEADSVHIEYISFLKRPRVAPEVEASITATITATQRSIEAQNMIVSAKAVAEQKIATARGDSLTQVIRSSATAASLIKEAQGQAEANEILNRSLTQQVIDWERTTRWNGQLPQVTSGGTPLLNLK